MLKPIDPQTLDIVERLRMEAKYFGGAASIEDVMREAADEIERLRGVLKLFISQKEPENYDLTHRLQRNR